jgi:hypothetical protein
VDWFDIPTAKHRSQVVGGKRDSSGEESNHQNAGFQTTYQALEITVDDRFCEVPSRGKIGHQSDLLFLGDVTVKRGNESVDGDAADWSKQSKGQHRIA